ncbi:MAG: hypothetical protein ACT4QF_04460 [Sporichthyaceae bacterium]
MPGLRRIAAFATAAVLLASCADSTGGAGNVVPSDPASLPDTAAAVDGPAFTGTVRNRAGEVVPGAAVVVTLLRSKAERGQIAAGAAASLGTTCLFTSQGCRAPRKEGVSAKDGTFAVPLPKNNGAAAVGAAITAVASVGDVADGTRVGTTLLLPKKDAGGAAIDVPVASTALELKRKGTRLDVVMPALEGAKAIGASKLTISQLTGEGDVSRSTTDLTGTDVTLPFDLRLAEDSRLLLDVSQAARVGDRDGRITATGVLAGDVVPASRDAACSVTDSRGKQLRQKICGLTDGVLGESWRPDDDPRCADGPCKGTAQKDQRDILVTLPKSVAARLIVVRGCGFTCTVTVSSDGRRYRDLPAPGNSGTSGFYVQPLSGAPVRYVKIRTATGGFFTSLREVSVFG